MEARASWNSSCSAWLTQAFPCCCCAVKCPSARRRPDVSGPSVMSAGPSLTEKSMWGVRQPHTPHWGTSEHRELQSFLSFEGFSGPKVPGSTLTPFPPSREFCNKPAPFSGSCPNSSYRPPWSQPLKHLSLRPLLSHVGPPSGITGLQGSQQQHHVGVCQTDVFSMLPSASIETDQGRA